MDILGIIYQLFIGPLELFFEIVFNVAYRFLHDPAASIVFLSLAMNILVLPLYRRADAMQEVERDRAIAMKPGVDHIKKTFTGDERFMMLQTYYRQIGYKQTDALRGSVSLLLEIPFFIAAFHFLSNLALLHGVSLGPIADLGAPDGLIQIGGLTINFLPILMTAINVVAAAIYMKGFPISSKVQMYGIAAIFLVLLYNSPSGLVFYWTLNNLFSLVKNIFYKLKNPRRVLTVILAVVGVTLVVLAFAAPLDSMMKRGFLVGCAVLLQVPAIARVVAKRVKLPKPPEATKRDDRAFLLGCVFLALFTGLFIPLSVIQASPGEFVSIVDYQSPLTFLVGSSALAIGLFVIWFTVFYRLATPRGRTVFCGLVWVLAGVFLVNYLFFGTTYGALNTALQFDRFPWNSPTSMAVNLGVLALVAAVLLFIWNKRRGVAAVCYGSLCVGIVAMSIVGILGVNEALGPAVEAAKARDNEAHFTLSKTNRNVVVIMMDRAIARYVPYIMNERPDIAQQYAGFTFYPNTLSYGGFTNVGSPGLYGGYEYIPEAINARTDATLEQKQNEALRVMPVTFDDAGYQVSVFDPSYAGYNETPDLSIYDDHPNIASYITMDGRFGIDEFGTKTSAVTQSYAERSRNFFCYALFKVSPLVLQPTIYNFGDYNSPQAFAVPSGEEGGAAQIRSPQALDGLSHAVGTDTLFAKAYAALEHLADMTRITDDGPGGFLMMSNNTAHEPTILSEPDYRIATQVDNSEFDAAHPGRYAADGSYQDLTDATDDAALSKLAHYQVNVAALQLLGNWLDFLRAQGVYDNTRIIVVSDHGRQLGLDPSMYIEVEHATDEDGTARDMGLFNCMLMVKDFDSTEYAVDERFMTNADTPELAFAGLFDNPVNPATGNLIASTQKQAPEQRVLWADFNIDNSYDYHFRPGCWFSVHDDVRQIDNWSYLGEY